jgi:hypothetical protein
MAEHFMVCTSGAPKAGRGVLGCSPPAQTPQNQNLKNSDFEDIMISKVLHLKSADDSYSIILKNKLMKFKKQEDRTL